MHFLKKHLKKISFLLSLLLILIGINSTSYAALHPFTDLDETHTYYNEMLYCYEKGFYIGTTETTFEPDIPLSRAMFVTLFGRMAESLGFTIGTHDSGKFVDVESGSWYEPYVNWGVAMHLIKGVTADRFSPNEDITREEASALMVRFAKACGINIDGAAEQPANYDGVSAWALTYMKQAVNAGLVIHSPGGDLSPEASATRAESAYLFHALSTKYTSGTETTQYITFQGKPLPVVKGIRVNPYYKGSFQTSGGYAYYNDGETSSVLGIDVSRFQGQIDWTQVKAAGVDFAIIRVGGRYYGRNSGTIYDDDNFVQNINGALSAGVKVGIYFFSQAINVQEAIDEAQFVLNKIQGYNVSYPVVFDWENIPGGTARTDGIDTATLTNCAIAFCDTIQRAGYKSMIYANQYVYYKMYNLTALQSYDFWLAEYNYPPTFYYDFQMLQYTDNGSVPGISGHVDMNISFIDYSKK